MKPRKLRTMALLAGASTLLGMGTAYAATQTVTSTIKFFSDITFTVGNQPNLGYGKAATGGVYTLDTANVVTPSAGGVIEGGTPQSGNFTIKGSGTQTINISAGSYTIGGHTTPSAATCKYNAVAVGGADCTGAGLAAPTGAGKALIVGLTATATAATVDGDTDSPTFVLTVVYN